MAHDGIGFELFRYVLANAIGNIPWDLLLIMLRAFKMVSCLDQGI